MSLTDARPVTIEPLTGTLGAIVHGVELSQPLSAEHASLVRDAAVRHRVIFLRDQHITPSQQVAFARIFGTLTAAHPLVGGLDAEHPEVLQLDSEDYPLGVGSRGKGTSYNNRWHTDVTFSATPPNFAVLAGKQIPARGGDTLWADLVDAYSTLSEPIRTLLDGLVAVHDASATFNRFRSEDPTGERGLFVNDTFTSAIEGLSPEESTALLQLLYQHTVAPERVVRWHWHEGDIAVWDNRSTAHYAAADYTERRVMHRVTVAGERPVGVHGPID
jgi:alpha-ketoglutarate-dependent taurine dioxygenase